MTQILDVDFKIFDLTFYRRFYICQIFYYVNQLFDVKYIKNQ